MYAYTVHTIMPTSGVRYPKKGMSPADRAKKREEAKINELMKAYNHTLDNIETTLKNNPDVATLKRCSTDLVRVFNALNFRRDRDHVGSVSITFRRAFGLVRFMRTPTF